MRVVLIGCGRAGGAHADILRTLPDIELIGIVDPSEEIREIARARFPECEVRRDSRRLRAWSPDLVDICTPPVLHEPYIGAALGVGAHVLCEKPVFLNPTEGRRLVAFAASSGLAIIPAHNYIHAPFAKELRRLRVSGLIGRPTRVEIGVSRTAAARGADAWYPGWRVHREYSGGGILFDHGPHSLYLAEWLSGERITHVRCKMHFYAPGVDDLTEMHLDLSAGVTADIRLDWTAGQRSVHYKLVGELGDATFDGELLAVSGSIDPPMGPVLDSSADSHAHREWTRALIAVSLTNVHSNRRPAFYADSALMVADAMSCAVASSRQGGAKVSMPPRLNLG